jgi:hypothetical protein
VRRRRGKREGKREGKRGWGVEEEEEVDIVRAPPCSSAL